MADDRNGMAKGLLLGFLAGSVVGAITALLYAPKSGKELRSDIRRKANEVAENAGDYVRTAREKASDMVNQGKERSNQLISETKEKAEHLLGDAEKVLTSIRERSAGESGKIKAAFRAGVDAYKTEKNRDIL